MTWFHFRNETDRAIENEIMVSDRLRAALVGTAFLATAVGLFVVWTQARLFETGPSALDFLARVPYPVAFVTLTLLGVYEWGYRFATGQLMKRGLKMPLPPRILNATLEVSVPTLALALLSTVVPPDTALNLPPVFLYYFFLALATLRLDPVLAAYTGVMAGLQYGSLAFFLLPHGGVSLPLDFWAAYLSKGILMAMTGGILAFVTQQIRSRLVNLLESREAQARMAAIFGQHVSPAVMKKLLTQKTELESEVRHVTVMFLDIRNFTTFSENRTPDEVVEYLNRLFAFMVDAVNDHHGIINKFLGDGFMAVFGAPLDDGKSELNALEAALAVSDRLKIMLGEGLEPTRIGIGLHSGSAVTGNVGSTQRREYTIIGDVVNLASRIESQTKVHGAEILVSKDVWDAAVAAGSPVTGQSVGPVTVKGRDAPVELFRIR
jgi:adenylate cyclase